MAKPVKMEVEIDLTHPALQRGGKLDETMVSVLFTQIAAKTRLQGITPGGVWGGMVTVNGQRVGHWLVRAEGHDDDDK